MLDADLMRVADGTWSAPRFVDEIATFVGEMRRHANRRTSFLPYYRGQDELLDPTDFDGIHDAYAPSVVQRGCTAFCTCGWHPANHPGEIVADHLLFMARQGCYVAGWPGVEDYRPPREE